ncbi:MAG: nucleotidyltransferase family protein [Methylocystaceae bacterium]
MQNQSIANLLISASDQLATVFARLEETSKQILLVVDDNDRLVGTLTDGDIRRAIISGCKLDSDISTVFNPSPIYVVAGSYNKQIILDLMTLHKVRQIPVLDNSHRVLELLTWDEIIGDKNLFHKKSNLVVLMAGGLGVRLDPFTKILPKPLIPLGEKTILELIIDNFQEYGFEEFVLSVNYKKNLIKLYLEDMIENRSFKVSYIEEDQPLGTAGSLYMLKNKVTAPFIVSNCDILLKTNYDDLLKFHNKNSHDITLVATLTNMQIPYGVIEYDGPQLLDIKEKPSWDFLINTGIYVLSPLILDLIADGVNTDMVSLVKKAKGQGLKVGLYPVFESFFDVGQWDEYRNSLRLLTQR